MNPHYAQVAERAGHRCEYCHAPEAIFNFAFEIEHIIPAGRGGHDDENNRALSCRSCNLFKSDQLDGIDPQTGKCVSLFNPRQNLWEEHFHVDQKSGRVMGLTPVGRATVDRLQMNRGAQLRARQQWMRLRLFP
jgi:hypothetical protein